MIGEYISTLTLLIRNTPSIKFPARVYLLKILEAVALLSLIQVLAGCSEVLSFVSGRIAVVVVD